MRAPCRYLLEVFRDARLGVKLDVDARRYGNETRFINHYANLAEAPNVAFLPYRLPSTGELAIAVTTSRPVKQGEELLADYFVGRRAA